MLNGPGFSFEKCQVIGSKGRVRLISSNERRRLVVWAWASPGACEEGCPGDDPSQELTQLRYSKIVTEIIKILFREGFIKEDSCGGTEPPRYPCPCCRAVKTFVEIVKIIYENGGFDSAIF